MSKNKIPKIIHYCWFGKGPLPPSAIKCIESWKKHMPDYEIKRWDESNYDINKNQYMKEAYECKKYAFVSDFARFDILYQYGGLYFDTDVELIRPLYDLINKGPFMGFETGDVNKLNKSKKGKRSKAIIAPGLGMCASIHLPFLKEMMNVYDKMHFITPNGKINKTTICIIVTNRFAEKNVIENDGIGLYDGIYLYPPTYFNPKGRFIDLGKIKITDKTYSIHHYDGTWKKKNRFKQLLRKIIGG